MNGKEVSGPVVDIKLIAEALGVEEPGIRAALMKKVNRAYTTYKFKPQDWSMFLQRHYPGKTAWTEFSVEDMRACLEWMQSHEHVLADKSDT